MSEELDRLAASYALGIFRGIARSEVETWLRSAPALQAKAEFWQNEFTVLDLAAPAEAPPPGLFDRIIGEIAVDQEGVPGTFTLRAGCGIWTEMAPGVSCKVLFEDPFAKRRSVLVRAQPGAVYESHVHDDGPEECLVLEGDFIIGDLRLLPGDFHLAPKGSMPPQATTGSGCLLYLCTPV
jgi:hypothetical protein